MSQTPGLGDLIEFLSARLDEAEEFAREANQAPWMCEDNFVENRDGGEIARFEIKANARFAAWNDPASALLDIEADRALLRRYVIGSLLLPGQFKGGYCEALDEVIKIRAARFSAHPDYQHEWAFDGV